MTANILFYSAELQQFQRIMLNGMAASMDGQDPRVVHDGGMSRTEVSLRDEGMARWLNNLPAIAAAAISEHETASEQDKAVSALIDQLLEELPAQQGESWQ